MKKTTHSIPYFIFWLLLLLGAGGLLVWALIPKALLVEIATLQKGPYEQMVEEEGKTRAKEVFEILSPVTGNLKRVQVHAGDPVKVGQVLAVVDRPETWEIKSPIQGRVLRVQRESSGPIERGTVIMELADPSALEIVAEVLTEDAISIQVGAPVKIQSWGGCQALEGQVRLIEPAAFTKVSALGVEEQRVKVIIDLTSPPEKCAGLGDGFRVYNQIITFHTPEALLLPTGALFKEDEDWMVFKVVEGRAQKTKVQILRRHAKQAMVGEGLKAGDQVIVYPNDEIEEGSRVQELKQASTRSKG